MTKELPAYICSHVYRRERAILLVSHEDGEWQFLCGGDHNLDELPHVVGINHLGDWDPAVREVADLPDGWEAERDNICSPWVKRKIQAPS